MNGLTLALLAGVAAHAGAVPPLPPVRMAPVITTPGARVAPDELSDVPVPAVRARTIHSLPTLFSTADYPAAALRNGETGVTAFAVTINREGRVTQCAITASSGSASLDATTCSIITRRARFEPARDAAGRTVEDSSHGRVRWMLPPLAPLPFAEQRMALVLSSDGAGALTGCRVEASAGVPRNDQTCVAMMPQAKAIVAAAARAGAMTGRELILEQGMVTGGAEAARRVGRGPGESRTTLFTLLLEIDPDGTISYCAGGDGAEDGERVAVACRDTIKRKFVPLDATAEQRTRHAVRYWATYTRPIG